MIFDSSKENVLETWPVVLVALIIIEFKVSLEKYDYIGFKSNPEAVCLTWIVFGYNFLLIIKYSSKLLQIAQSET